MTRMVKAMMERRIDRQTEAIARQISSREKRPWYICRRTGCKDVVVSEQDLNRYMRLGYKVLCAYYDGKQYKNIYQLEGKLHFVWREEGERR